MVAPSPPLVLLRFANWCLPGMGYQRSYWPVLHPYREPPCEFSPLLGRPQQEDTALDDRGGNSSWALRVLVFLVILSLLEFGFTAEVWAIIKALKQIQISTASKYIVFRLTFVSPSFTSHEAGTHPLIGMVIRKCVFLNIAKKTLFFVGYPAILALRAMKRQIQLPSLPWICLVPRLVYPIMILNIVSTNIYFPLGKMIGTVRSRTSFILSSQSWEIGSPPTGGAGSMK